jgi:hypothetical protein
VEPGRIGMHVKVDWKEPIQLTRHKKLIIEEKELLIQVAALPGIYFFSRRHGSKFEPFYIGETNSVQRRLRSHWRSAAIKDVLRGIGDETINSIKGGERYFHYGYLVKNAAEPKKYLRIGQKYLIRQAMAQGITLLNKSLTKINVDTMEFIGSVKGRAIYPKKGEVEA